MTHRIDVARGRDIVARWSALAERRLDYLTELFETGRWRRFHSEVAFLENIQEAKAAVETWRDLLTREASPDNSADRPVLARPRQTDAAARRQTARRLVPFRRLPAGSRLQIPVKPPLPRRAVAADDRASFLATEAPSAPRSGCRASR